MGLLGTNLNMNDQTKTVIAEVIDKEDCYEIIFVYGNNEDFDVAQAFLSNMPMQFSKEGIIFQLQKFKFYSDFPIYTCQISHNGNVMSREEAFEKILNATEPWEGNSK